MPKIYITTAIDYVNAKPHVGHAVEKIQADALSRWYRQKGEDVYFLSGTDEMSLKNVQAAKKEGMTVADFVDRNSGYFRDLKKQFDLSYDYFIRTTEEKHIKGVQKLWNMFKKEDIYKEDYKGYYCVGCEEFKTERDLVDGKCQEHDTKPELIEEENYFFALSKYQNQIIELIESNKLQITPDFRRNEMLSFLKGGLDDFSISRSTKRAENWGVPVPNDPDQVMYVWIDALSNYITALDFATDGENYKKYWENGDERIHVVGKGILRFHAIYWIGMLLSAGLKTPTKIICHEYLTMNGKKMSKSIGNIIDPEELVEKYGSDASRYLLLSALPSSKDGDISWDKMDEKYTADLANSLGNLVQRTISMINKYEVKPDAKTDSKINLDSTMIEGKYDQVLLSIMKLAESANKYIAEREPWTLAKEGKTDELTKVLQKSFDNISNIAELILPFMPETSEKIKGQLETLEPQVLFPRIEQK